MKIIISGLACGAVMLLISSSLQAEDNGVALSLIDGERIEDSQLDSIRAKGATVFSPEKPEALSVILWDEKGGTKTPTRYESATGSGNIQKVNVVTNRN